MAGDGGGGGGGGGGNYNSMMSAFMQSDHGSADYCRASRGLPSQSGEEGEGGGRVHRVASCWASEILNYPRGGSMADFAR